MDSALAVHRLHFAFTITFHYLFPQLTMGLALLIVILKTLGSDIKQFDTSRNGLLEPASLLFPRYAAVDDCCRQAEMIQLIDLIFH